VNAAEQANSIEFASKIAAVVGLFKAEFPDLRADLKRTGRPIPANDAWIAALALEHALPVLSRDAHFDVVARLKRIAW